MPGKKISDKKNIPIILAAVGIILVILGLGMIIIPNPLYGSGLIILLIVVGIILLIIAFILYLLSIKRLRLFALIVLVVWGVGTVAYIDYYPHLIYNAWDNAIVKNGDGATPNSSGIPVNTLYTLTTLASPSTHNNVAGANHDTLYTLGVLDLSKGPQVLHVPNMDGRYYSIEFVDPWGDASYVGQRTTGTQAGDYLISGPGLNGNPPTGMKQIASSDNSVLVLGRVLVYNDSDLTTAYNLSIKIQLTPLT